MGKLLFHVEFGEPSLESYGGRSDIKSVFILADSYNEAEQKAEKHLNKKLEEILLKSEKSVLTSDGSLRLPVDDERPIYVRVVKLISDNVIL